MTVSNTGNSVVFNDGKRKQSFPTGTVILTSDEDSKSINVKGVGSRRTLLTFTCDEVGYQTAEEAVNELSALM